MSDKNETTFDWGGIAGAGLGMISNLLVNKKKQDKRQIEQQKKLTDIQSEANREQADYQNKLAMDMWKNTNYDAQKNEMQKAGLSIGAMYGGSGAGGATTGGASVAGVGAGSAADSASTANADTNKLNSAMQAMNLSLLKAQKENIEADTANKQAGAENTGIDTQGKKVDVEVKTATKEDAKSKIVEDARKAMYEQNIAATNSVVNEESQKAQINLIKAEAAGKVLENALTEGKIQLTKEQINEIKEKIKQGWKGLEFQGVDKVTGKYLEQILDMGKKVIKND